MFALIAPNNEDSFQESIDAAQVQSYINIWNNASVYIIKKSWNSNFTFWMCLCITNFLTEIFGTKAFSNSKIDKST